MSTNTSVSATLAIYLAVIFSGQHLMKNYKAFKLQNLFMLHNVLLSAGSGILLLCMVEELIPVIAREGLYGSICSKSAWTPRLEQLYIINYYFKYWELVDTLFLVAKKKPLKFLHYFHHSNTALLCFVQLNGRTSVSWVPITINLAVHVLMYYYATAAGYTITWKKYITTMQISQFVIDLVVVYFASYNLFASRYASGLPHCGKCSGTEGAAIFGCGLLTSYLFLFIAFYRATYKPRSKVSASRSPSPGAEEKSPLLKKSDSDDSLDAQTMSS
ncbi:hypothetical protein RQP46_003097 [Phenoliferia psychrophenolica]